MLQIKCIWLIISKREHLYKLRFFGNTLVWSIQVWDDLEESIVAALQSVKYYKASKQSEGPLLYSENDGSQVENIQYCSNLSS